jgi:hypothetical protein
MRPRLKRSDSIEETCPTSEEKAHAHMQVGCGETCTLHLYCCRSAVGPTSLLNCPWQMYVVQIGQISAAQQPRTVFSNFPVSFGLYLTAINNCHRETDVPEATTHIELLNCVRLCAPYPKTVFFHAMGIDDKWPAWRCHN